MLRRTIAVLSFGFVIGANGLGQSLRDEANALASKFAATTIYLTGDATLPYHERVSFKLFRSGKGDLTGHFSKDYLSWDEWRERYDLGDYVTVKVRSGQEQGDFRSAAYEPLVLTQLRQVLPPVVIAFSSIESVKKIDERSVRGTSAHCIQYQNSTDPNSYEGEACFDDATRILLSSRRQGTGRLCNPRCVVRETEWFDYSPYRERLYARRVVVKTGGRPIIEASVEFTPGEDLKPATFAMPQGFQVSKACDHTSSPVRIKGDLPSFPHRLNEFGYEGTVIVQARIGVDGRVQDVQVVNNSFSSSQSPSAYRPRRDIEKVLEDAVRQWQFEPARCDGMPIVDNVAFPVLTEVR